MSSTAVVLADGFMQPEFFSHALRKIRRSLQRMGISVEMYDWSDHEQIPQIAARVTQHERIVLAGHSWGGWFCNELATALDGQAAVADMLLADPVTRPPGGSLCIPPNVKRLHVWSKLAGKIPTAEIYIEEQDDPQYETQLVTNEVVDVGHARVDDVPEFRAAVIAAART